MAERRPASAGFTLLELIIVLALFGLIALALGSGLRFGARMVDVQARTLQVTADLDPVWSLLRGLVTTARVIDGDAVSVTLVAALPAALGAAEAQEIAIGTEGDRLVLAWGPYRRNTTRVEAGRVDLATGIEGLDLAYFGAPQETAKAPPAGGVTPEASAPGGSRSQAAGGPVDPDAASPASPPPADAPAAPPEIPSWRASWRAKDGIPDLVRIRLAQGPDDRRRWVELLVAPRSAGDRTAP